MNDLQIISRVAARYLVAKGGATLVPEFQKAVKEYSGEGNAEPIRSFIQKVLDIIQPGGKVAPWFHGLGTAKRNTIKFLNAEGQSLLGSLSPHQIVHDPEKWRQYVTMNLEKWGSKLRTLELSMVAGDEERVINVGGFRVVPMPGVTKTKTADALAALEEATQKVQAVFPKVIYGEVYFSTHLQKNAAAWYVPSEDKLYLDVNAKKRFSDVFTIVHELGHRFDDRLLKKDLKSQFFALSTRKVYEKIPYDKALRESVAEEVLSAVKARKESRPMAQLSDQAMLWLQTQYTPGKDAKRLTGEYMQGRITEDRFKAELAGSEDINIQTDKLLHGPLTVSPYGATKPSENWADAFAMYVLGMPLHEELKAILDEAR